MLHRSGRVRRIGMAAAVLALAAMGAARGATPDILNQIPGDAYGVAVVNNVRTFANNISNAATRLKIDLPPDLIGYVTNTVGISEGFDLNGSVALVLLKPATEKPGQPYFSDEAPPAVLLLPTSDPKAMLAPFKPGEPDKDGILEISLPSDREQKGYAAIVKNKWIALGQKREDVASYVARGDSFAKKVSADTLKVFENNDLIFWGNIEKLGAASDKWIDDQETDITGMMDLQNVARHHDAVAAAIEHHTTAMMFTFARQFFKDARAGMFTVRLNDSGATIGATGDFKPDTPIGKFVAAQGKQQPPSLAGLPNGGDFVAAGAARLNVDGLSSALETFVNNVLADPAVAKDQRLPDLKKAFTLGEQQLPLVNGVSFVFLSPHPSAGPADTSKNGIFNGAMLIDSKDPQKLLALQMQSTQNLLMQESMNPDLKQTVDVKTDAATVSGVHLNRITIKIALRDETPEKPIADENKAAAKMLERVYGEGGLTTYLGVVGNRMIMIYGSDHDTINAAIAAAQANSEDLAKAKEIANIKDQLVANPIAVAYLPIARWVQLAQTIAGPQDNGAEPGRPMWGGALAPPPAVFSVGISGQTMTAEFHLPIGAITGVQQAIQRLERSMREVPTPDAPPK